MSRFQIFFPAALIMCCGCVNSSDAPTPESVPYEAPLTDSDRTSLRGVHGRIVEQFASSPFFGGERMVIRNPIEDVITPPPQSESVSQVNPEQRKPIGPKAGERPIDVHHTFAHLFGTTSATVQGETWKLKNVQLVGLVVHPEPVVYDTDRVPGMKPQEKLPTRELDSFEEGGLAALRRGEPLKFERKGDTARMMGPIYAGKKCLKCHDRSGELLGAFSYVLERSTNSTQETNPIP